MTGPLALQLGRQHAATKPASIPRVKPTPSVGRQRSAVFAQDAPLLVHGRVSEANALGTLCAALELGAVYTTSRPDQVKHAKRAHALAGAPAGAMLFDRGRYAGNGREWARLADLDPHWVAEQVRCGCDFGLTDSGYLPAGDREGLVKVLGQAAHIDRAIVALPVAPQWLTKDADVLVTEINRYGLPVAFMLEHRKDPLGLESTVRGFVHIVSDSKAPVFLLRGDTSGIGALALGAAGAAIGTSTALRHFYPLSPGGGGVFGSVPSAFVPSAMSYRKLDTINHAIAHSDVDSPFMCTCEYCANTRLDSLIETTVVPHSMASQQALARAVLEDPVVAVAEWVEHCRHALSVNQELQAQIESMWPIPGFLSAWLKVLG